jgi:hypothetical protein
MSVEFEFITTKDVIDKYLSSSIMFNALIKEVRELSKKKPDMIISSGKVKIINRVLNDLTDCLKTEPSGKYLDLLDDEALPQVSDAVLIMAQFEAATAAFESRYHKYVYGNWYWVTDAQIEDWKGRFGDYDDAG